MFAYCNNNPANKSDPNGKDPITAGAIGGAVAGAALSLTFYLGGAGDSATFGEALLYTALGALGGALGGAAGMATGDVRLACVIGAGVVAGLASDLSGGSFLVGSLWGTLGAYVGTLLDLSMFSGFELGAASYLSSSYVGFFSEIFSQTTHKMIPEPFYDNSSTYNNSGGSSAPTRSSIGPQNATYVGLT